MFYVDILTDHIRLEAVLVSHLLLDLRHLSVRPNGRGTQVKLPTAPFNRHKENYTTISEFEYAIPQEVYAAAHLISASPLSGTGHDPEHSVTL